MFEIRVFNGIANATILKLFTGANRLEESMISQSRCGIRAGLRWICLLVWSVICCFFVFGCGGGGGSSSGPNGISYSGISTPAEITADNANAIAASALETRTTAGGFTGIATLNSAGQAVEASYQPYLTGFSQAMKGAVEQIDIDSASRLYQPATVESENGIINGSCGGKASFSIQVVQETGTFSGNVSFNGFCEDGVSISGPTVYSGIINLNTLELESFTITFDYVAATSLTESYTMDGRLDCIQSGSTAIVTLNMAIQDNNVDRIGKVEDYQIVITDGYGQTELEITGRFYDPEYGYVDLDTDSVLIVNDEDDYPNSGVVICTGELGSAGGATKARLTALSEIQCRVEADSNGDGSYDYDSGPISWAELENPV